MRRSEINETPPKPTAHLLPTEVLDARPRVEFDVNPTRCSDNIPVSELRESVFRLPRKCALLLVADTGPEAADAVSIISDLGRAANLIEAQAGEPTQNRYRLWSLPAILLRQSADLPPGRALCLACGAGREAVALAAEGWQVTALDVLPDALDRARRLEDAYKLPGSTPIQWRIADLRRELPDDLTEFDLVTQFRFWHSRTKQHLLKALKPGGIGILEQAKRGWPANEWDGWIAKASAGDGARQVVLHLPD